jgi:hypothetical protein
MTPDVYGDVNEFNRIITTKAVQSVLAERVRQVTEEGWTPEHDDDHYLGEIAQAAACYALTPSLLGWALGAGKFWGFFWPWSYDWWKPTNRRRDLVKAGALIIAEIERLDRCEDRAKEKTDAKAG